MVHTSYIEICSNITQYVAKRNLLFIFKTLNAEANTGYSAGAAFLRSAEIACCVPGLARLLNGDVRNYGTNVGQSPDPP
jgi:hypothetical protein